MCVCVVLLAVHWRSDYILCVWVCVFNIGATVRLLLFIVGSVYVISYTCCSQSEREHASGILYSIRTSAC